jgi:hypothetical protein
LRGTGISLLVTLLFVGSGCSVLERHSYFTAAVEPGLLSGPASLPCGWKNFSGPPNRVTYRAADRWLTIDADQAAEPYLLGPWIASIIPVFPFTWLLQALPPHYLFVTFDADPVTLRYLRGQNFLVLVPANPKPPHVVGGALGRYAAPNQARFPVDPRHLEMFTLRVLQVGNPAADVDIPFVAAHRWAWVQYSPYC